MKIYVHPCNKKNIGDELNYWFWNETLGDIQNIYHDDLLVGIGTVLNDKLPKNKNLHILGSGAGYGNITDTRRWNIHFVRGFLTAKKLNIDSAKVISDPAILISKLKKKQDKKKYDISFIPHVNIDSTKYRDFIHSLNWNYISPSDDEDLILSEIASSERIITSAMHGAILADSYRVPWAAVSTSSEILHFKWLDWFSSLSLHYKLIHLPPLWSEKPVNFKDELKDYIKYKLISHKLKAIEKNGKFLLSNHVLLKSKQNQLEEKMSAIKALFTKIEVHS